ncbi:MAG: WG repeat-containing protein [Bacteroidia bacterium]
MPLENPHNNFIPFEEFISFLRSNGFPVGVDTHLRVQRLLEELGSTYPADRLKTLLAPVFAHSTEEQEIFYRLFDDFFENDPAALIRNYLPPSDNGQSSESPGPSGMLQFLSRRRSYLLLQIFLLLGMGYLGVQGIDCYIKTGNIQQAAYCILGIQNPFHTNNTPYQIPDSLAGMEVNVPDSTFQSSGYPEILGDKDSLHSPVTRQIPLEDTGLIREDISDLKAGLFQQYGPLVKVLFMFTLVMAFFFYESYWRNRRKLLMLEDRSKLPPYSWNVHSPRPDFHLYTEQKFFEATRRLREREHGEMSDLNIDKSISQTVAEGGYPTPAFDPRSRPPEYLVLISKQNARDHQAMLFDQLILELSQQDIYIERYFYDHDPRLCWKEKYVNEILLEELHRQYPDNRVVIIGQAEPFFDPVTDRLAGWTEILRKWKQVAIVSPAPPLSWGHRESVLARQFIFLPSTTEALSVIVDIFNDDQHPPLRHWIAQNTYPPQPDAEYPLSIDDLKKYFDTRYEGLEEIYEPESGKDLFDWLCACAVHPVLSWDLTLAFGEAIGEERTTPLVNPRNLLKLISLPWFRTGEIPEELRDALFAQIPAPLQAVARKTVVRILRDNPPPQGSYAEAEHQLSLAIQEAELEPSLGKNLRLIQQAQTYSLNHEIKDKTVIKSLRYWPESTFSFSLPESVNEWLFRQGIPALGLRTWVRAVATIAAVFMIALSLDPSRLDRVHTFSGERYFLANKSSRMRFHAYVGNAYFDSLNYPAARENYQISLLLKKETRREDYLTPDFNLSMLQWKEGNTEEAREAFARLGEKATELESGITTTGETQKYLARLRSDASYNQGVIYYRNQQTESAEEQFRDAVKADSSHAQAIYAEAVLFLQKAIPDSGASQQNSLTLAFNRVDDLLNVSPGFFKNKPAFVEVLDSIRTNAQNAQVSRRAESLLSAIAGRQVADSLTENPPVTDTILTAPAPGMKYITGFIEGLALVEYRGKYGFVDSAVSLMGIIYQDARPFSEGLAAVRMNNQWGFINRRQEMIIPYQYDNAKSFRQRLASVKSVGKWGVIDTQGNVVIPFTYEQPVEFEDIARLRNQEPWAVVYVDGKYQYINRKGEPMLKGMKFQYAENFSSDNRARVKRYEQWFQIDREGNCIAASAPDGKCPQEKWEATLTYRLRGLGGPVNASLYAPDGSFLVTAGADGNAIVWNPTGEKIYATLAHGGKVYAAAISPDSRYLATGGDNNLVKIWKREGNTSWSQVHTIEDARAAVWSVAFSPDSRFVASGSADQMIRVYTLNDYSLLHTLAGHDNGAILSLAFSPRGKRLISGGEDKTVRIWDWEQGRSQGTVPGRIGEVQSTAFSRNGQFLALGTRENLVKIYEMSGDSPRLIIQLDEFEDWVSTVAFSPDGRYLLTTSYDNRLRVFNLITRDMVLTIRHPGTVRSAAFSPDGKYILTASWGEGGSNRASVFEVEIY